MINIIAAIHENMKLFLAINRNNLIELSLVIDKKTVDRMKWKENNDLSRFFLAKIDALLKKNKTGLDKISGYKIMTDVPKKWTSCRIIEITLRTLMLAKKNRV